MSAAPELFDLYDAEGHALGQAKARDDVHRDGDWHRSAHIWIYTSDGRLLFQRLRLRRFAVQRLDLRRLQFRRLNFRQLGFRDRLQQRPCPVHCSPRILWPPPRPPQNTVALL